MGAPTRAVVAIGFVVASLDAHASAAETCDTTLDV